MKHKLLVLILQLSIIHNLVGQNSPSDSIISGTINAMAIMLENNLKPWPVPDRIFKVEDYGAVADGEMLCTQAIQKAVDACNEAGGGVVLFSKGSYHTGTIYLKSNVMLQVEKDALIIGSRNIKSDYPASPKKEPYVNPLTGLEYINNPNPKQQALFIAVREKNIGIRGEGKINFRGHKWNPFYLFTSNSKGIQPFGLRMMECKNIVVQNITLVNANKWMQLYMHCENVIIDGIKVLNQVNFENDGVDIDGCRNVIIRNSTFSSEDDGICLKGMSGMPTENILIENCAVYSLCNAFKIGTDTEGDFKNIVVRDCVLGGVPKDSVSHFGYRRMRKHRVDASVALEAVDGGVAENIMIQNCEFLRSNTPVFLRSGRRNRVTKQTPNPVAGILRNVIITDIKGTDNGKNGSFISGIEKSWIENVTIRNYAIEVKGVSRKITRKIPKKEDVYPDAWRFNMLGRGFPAYGFWIRNAQNIRFENIAVTPTIKKVKRPCIALAENTCNITIDGTAIESKTVNCHP